MWDDDEEDFPESSPPSWLTYIFSRVFSGARPGWVFKLGDRGIGYYRDRPASLARLVCPEAAPPAEAMSAFEERSREPLPTSPLPGAFVPPTAAAAAACNAPFRFGGASCAFGSPQAAAATASASPASNAPLGFSFGAAPNIPPFGSVFQIDASPFRGAPSASTAPFSFGNYGPPSSTTNGAASNPFASLFPGSPSAPSASVDTSVAPRFPGFGPIGSKKATASASTPPPEPAPAAAANIFAAAASAAATATLPPAAASPASLAAAVAPLPPAGAPPATLPAAIPSAAAARPAAAPPAVAPHAALPPAAPSAASAAAPAAAPIGTTGAPTSLPSFATPPAAPATGAAGAAASPGTSTAPGTPAAKASTPSATFSGTPAAKPGPSAATPATPAATPSRTTTPTAVHSARAPAATASGASAAAPSLSAAPPGTPAGAPNSSAAAPILPGARAWTPGTPPATVSGTPAGTPGTSAGTPGTSAGAPDTSAPGAPAPAPFKFSTTAHPAPPPAPFKFSITTSPAPAPAPFTFGAAASALFSNAPAEAPTSFRFGSAAVAASSSSPAAPAPAPFSFGGAFLGAATSSPQALPPSPFSSGGAFAAASSPTPPTEAPAPFSFGGAASPALAPAPIGFGKAGSGASSCSSAPAPAPAPFHFKGSFKAALSSFDPPEVARAPFSFGGAASSAPAPAPLSFKDIALAALSTSPPVPAAPFAFHPAAWAAFAPVSAKRRDLAAAASSTAPAVGDGSSASAVGDAARASAVGNGASASAASSDMRKHDANAAGTSEPSRRLAGRGVDTAAVRADGGNARIGPPAFHFGHFGSGCPFGTPAADSNPAPRCDAPRFDAPRFDAPCFDGPRFDAPRFSVGKDPAASPKPTAAAATASPAGGASPFRFGVPHTGNADIDAILHSLQLSSDAARRVSTISASSNLSAAVAAVGRLAACTLGFTRALEQEAIRVQQAEAAQQHCSAEVHTAFAAVRSQILAASPDKRSALHPLMSDTLVPLDSLRTLQLIPELARQEEERVCKAEEGLRSLDLHKLHEDRWREQARERDDGRRNFIHLQQMRLAGLRAKQRWVERQLESAPEEEDMAIVEASNEGEGTADAEGEAQAERAADGAEGAAEADKVKGSEADADAAAEATPPAATSSDSEKGVRASTQVSASTAIPSAATPPVATSPASTPFDAGKAARASPEPSGPWRQMLTSLESISHVSTQAREQIGRMSEQSAEAQRSRWATLRAELQLSRQGIVETERSLRTPWKLHQRRLLGDARLCELQQIKAQVDAMHKEVVGARHQAENLELTARPGDRRLTELRSEHRRCQSTLKELRSRCGALAALMTELSQWPPPGRASSAEGAAGESIFPELPVRAHRILEPMSAREELSAEDQARFDIELLLRQNGLLVYNQTYDASFKDITSIAAGKPNVKRATVRGSAPERVKVLKEYSVADFRSIERAITTSRWLSHPGVVPVECAFVERADVVVVQMPFFAGGNLREWSQRHNGDLNARLRAAQRVAEAVRFLHANDVMHRDLKPENVVLDSIGADAAPALCDFDLSVTQASVGTTTRVRGTLLYLAPDDVPSKSSDIFSLGMLFLDVLFCVGDEAKFTSWLGQRTGHSGRFVVDEPSLERLRSDLRRCTAADTEVASRLRAVNIGIPMLIEKILKSDCRERPTAAAVAARLCEILDLRVCSLCFSDCSPADIGIECAQGHFTCQHCFSRHVCFPESLRTASEAGQFRSVVKCGMAYGRDACEATFTLQQTAQCVTSPAFETLRRNADDLQLVELQREFERWKVEHEAAQAQRTDLERRVLSARHRMEELQADSCPRCERVFVDFEGCAALTCGFADCGAAFCAFCLEDCGDDSHAHVRRCRLNPRRDEYYVDKTTWASIRRAERIVSVRAYWAELSPPVREQLARDANVSSILRELALHAELAQAAQ